ncbi:hypothetical protein [Nostoc sp.]|uniref:hypothetical protein n=1 Tax=Nostoc sp. TaxID=1180 RepID=UPI002FFB86F8
MGVPPRGTAERVSRLEATVVGSADSQATGSQKSRIIVFQALAPFEMVRQLLRGGSHASCFKSAEPPNALAPHEELPLAQR